MIDAQQLLVAETVAARDLDQCVLIARADALDLTEDVRPILTQRILVGLSDPEATQGTEQKRGKSKHAAILANALAKAPLKQHAIERTCISGDLLQHIAQVQAR